MSALGIVFTAFVLGHVAHAVLVHNKKKRAEEAGSDIPLTTLVLGAEPLVVLCCGFVRRPRFRANPASVFQTALLLMAWYLAAQQGIFTRALVSPVFIGLGLVLGHLVFGISLLITQRSVREAIIHFIDIGSIWEYSIESPNVLLQFMCVSVAEELIYRVGLQSLVLPCVPSPAVGIVIVAVLFSLVHEHFFKNPLVESLEFFGFALLLGALYYWTGSFILVVVIHAIRNIEIAFLEHLVRAQELGNEELAHEEADFRNGDRLLVMLFLPVLEGAIGWLEFQDGPASDTTDTRPAQAAAW